MNGAGFNYTLKQRERSVFFSVHPVALTFSLSVNVWALKLFCVCVSDYFSVLLSECLSKCVCHILSHSQVRGFVF